MNPVLKWAGGKRKLVPELLKRLPSDVDRRRHVEPFAGGAALFFAREPQRARIGDVNPFLMEFYRLVALRLPELLVAVSRWVEEYNRSQGNAYMRARDTFNSCRSGAMRWPGDVERAALFLFLNKTCFNGLWRENRKGDFNVPMGRYKSPTIADEPLLRCAQSVLRGAAIEWCDFDFGNSRGDGLGYAEDDFVYFDPPYVPLNPTSNFTSYSAGGFGKQHQERLASLFRRLSGRRIPCMLSNSDTPLVHELYAGFLIEVVHAARAINSDASKRGPVREVIVRNEACCG